MSTLSNEPIASAPAADPPADASTGSAPLTDVPPSIADGDGNSTTVGSSMTPSASTLVAAAAVPAANSSAGRKAAGKGRDWSDGQSAKRQKGNDRQWSPRERNQSRKDGSSTSAPEKSKGEDEEDEEGGGGGGFGRKRKVALAVMYRGSAYNGLQLQNGVQPPGQPTTVERELMDAIFAAGGISPDNMNDTQKIKWMRAARTDKGVHAAGNILSLMMVPDGPPPATCKSQSLDITERINAHLPADIRVIGWCRTLGGFHAKFACTSRVYEYIIPSFVFDDDPATVAAIHSDDTAGGESARPASADDRSFTYPDRVLSYRLTPEKTAAIRAILNLFKGTLNYQNFTRKKSGFLKDSVKEKPKWNFKEKKEGGKEDAASEDEGEGLDDAAEEALERQQFAASQQHQSAAVMDRPTSSSSTGPSPFARPAPVGGIRTHNLLHTNLKSPANSKGGNPKSQTNKVSGQYARFIRYVMEFDIEETYVHALNGASASTSDSISSSSGASSRGLELVRFRIHGQSFMLNQIRKMIGLVIIVARGQLPVSYITDKAFKYDDYSVPTAPSLGLLLQRPVYEMYDAKVGGTPDRMPIGDLFLSEPFRSRVQSFRAHMIYKQIGDAEMKTGSAYHWCSRLWNNPACVQQRGDEEAAQQMTMMEAEQTDTLERLPEAPTTKLEGAQ